MSGAASLSAARRRRAGGAGSGDAPPPPQPAGQPQQAPRRPPHPMQILEDHEIRLRNIEASTRGSDGQDAVGVSSGFDDGLLQSLMQRISALETRPSMATSGDESQDIKSQLLKLQTFAIETNTLVMKIQKEIDTLTSGTKAAFDRLSALESNANVETGEQDNNADGDANSTANLTETDKS